MSKNFKSAGSAALSFCLTFGVVGLLAEPSGAAIRDQGSSNWVEVSERVSTAGLDLTKPADMRRLESRIRSATRRICNDHNSRGNLANKQRCTQTARDSVKQQLAALADRSQHLAGASESINISSSIARTAARED